MVVSLNNPNFESSNLVWNNHVEENFVADQYGGVSSERTDWYLKEWMTHFKKRQVSLVNELGWNKQKASYLWNGKQPYNRDIVNELAGWLDLEAYELLMPPSKALQLRALQQSALQIAASLSDKN